MSDNEEKEFLSKVKKEIEEKIKTENKAVKKVETEHTELKTAIKGYDEYYEILDHFISESMNDFSLSEEDLPHYFQSNIHEKYQECVNIRKDAFDEEESLKKYINHCKKEVNNNKRTLKFYRSQYLDSDFFDECLPLVEIYQKKIDLYEENQTLTLEIIEKLRKIADKLKGWE